MQDKAVKCIDPNLRTGIVYHTYKILTVDQMIELELCKLGFCMVNDLLPKPLLKAQQMDHHDQSTTNLSYETRNRAVPNLPKATHSRYRNSYLYQAMSVYSKLPPSITNQTRLNGFTNKCKVYSLK